MKPRESSLWSWLASAKLALGGNLDMRRIENVLEAGHWDVEGCFAGTCFVVELKTAERPVRATTPIRVGLTPVQAMSLSRRISAGGRAWLLISVGVDRSKYLIPGRDASVVLEGIPEDTLAALSVFTAADPSAEMVIRAMCNSLR